MLKVHAPTFCHAILVIGRVQILVAALDGKFKDLTNPGVAPTKSQLESLVARMRDLATTVDALGAHVTKRAAEEVIEHLQKQSTTFRKVAEQFKYIEKTFRYELERTLLFALPPARQEYWLQSKPLFGTEVSDRFPFAVDDIAEAGKCLATERGTAAVFHLMRIMEVGLKDLAGALGIPYAPSWESYIRQISDRIATKHASKVKKWKKQEPFFRDVLGDLQAVKTSWRNPTMHVVKKYTPDEAEDIYRAVRTFMQRLASGLPPLTRSEVKARLGVFG